MRAKISLVDVKDMANRYFVLSSPVRLKILKVCAKSPHKMRDLNRLFSLSANSITDHIKILDAAGFVQKTRNRDNSVTVKTLVKIDEKGKVIL